ncbi:MAG: hypothetical protein LC721_02190 [Actinobacteria bacterium]|nr:hypothetical protein [Actinomycetota bacterium]
MTQIHYTAPGPTGTPSAQAIESRATWRELFLGASDAVQRAHQAVAVLPARDATGDVGRRDWVHTDNQAAHQADEAGS